MLLCLIVPESGKTQGGGSNIGHRRVGVTHSETISFSSCILATSPSGPPCYSWSYSVTARFLANLFPPDISLQETVGESIQTVCSVQTSRSWGNGSTWTGFRTLWPYRPCRSLLLRVATCSRERRRGFRGEVAEFCGRGDVIWQPNFADVRHEIFTRSDEL